MLSQLRAAVTGNLGTYLILSRRASAASRRTHRAGPAFAHLAGTEAILGDFAISVAHARRARQVAETLGDLLLEARACRSFGKLLTRMQKSIAEGVEVIERAFGRPSWSFD
jgi:hypothetical protein